MHHKNKSWCVKTELLSKLCKQENLISLKFPTWTHFCCCSNKHVDILSGNIKMLPAMVKILILWQRNLPQDNQERNRCSQPELSQLCVICNKKGEGTKEEERWAKTCSRLWIPYIENWNNNVRVNWTRIIN